MTGPPAGYSDEAAEHVNEDAAYRALRAGDADGALDLAGHLLLEASSLPTDDWNRGNLLHHGHIIRGKVFLQRGDVDASLEELRAAGAVAGSPQLDSFGPDLSLAWAHLRAGRNAEVTSYFRDVARFWSPTGNDTPFD